MNCILIVDDHPVIGAACRVLLEPIGIDNVVAVHDAVEGQRAFVERQPDVAVIDLTLCGTEQNGLDLIARIRASDPGAKVLVFSMHANASNLAAAIEAGATSYLVKDAPTEEFVKAVQQTRSGRRYIDPRLVFKLAFPSTALLPEERRALALLKADAPYVAIADQLELNQKTVVSLVDWAKHKRGS